MTTALPAIDPATGQAVIARRKVKANGAEPALAFRLWHELSSIQPPQRLIKKLLGTSSLACFWGTSGCGKTFLGLDAALHIALGRPWFGLPVTQLPALYIAAEGQLGVCNRIAAFRDHHALDIDSNVPFALLPAPLDLCAVDGATAWLLEQVDSVKAKMDGLAPGLIVVDTLARCFGAGDEGSTQDMNAFIANLDKLRLATGAAILVIHHSGKDSSRGERGSSALRAAVDTSIEVTGQSGTRTFRVEKQKDGESGATFSFVLKPIEIGLDDEGEPITSCVVEPTDAAPASERDRTAKLTPQTKIVLAAMREAIDRQGTVPPASNYIPKNVSAVGFRTFKEMSGSRLGSDMQADTKEKAIRRALERLQEAGIIGVFEDWVWIEKR